MRKGLAIRESLSSSSPPARPNTLASAGVL
jgi:hypothetical protein